jgi:hypothetical protein
MKADRLLRLYPRAWRDRYADELLAMVGDRPLQLPQIIDLVSGAIDAHLSSDVRATTVSRRHAASIEGGSAGLNHGRQSACTTGGHSSRSATPGSGRAS